MQPVPIHNRLAALPTSFTGGNGLRTGTGDSLSVPLILNITSSKDTLNAGKGSARLGDNIAIGVSLKLALDEGGSRIVTDGIEKTVGLKSLLLASGNILDDQVAHETLVVTLDLDTDGVEPDSDLLVVQQPMGHDAAGPQLVLANQHCDVAAILGEVHSLLSSGVATTNDNEVLVAENRNGTIANGAGRDTVLPVLLLPGEMKSAGRGTGGQDDGVGSVVLLGGPLGSVLEGAGREVDLGNGLADNLGAETLRLSLHLVHQLLAHDAIGETGEVLDLGRGGELATGSDAIGHEALVEYSCTKGEELLAHWSLPPNVDNCNGIELTLQLGAGQVDGGSVGGRPRADDDYFAVHVSFCDGLKFGRLNRSVFLEGGCGSSDCETRCAGSESSSKG